MKPWGRSTKLGERVVADSRTRGSGSDLDGDGGSGRRLLRVLFAFSVDTPLATAEELARRSGLPLSSTYRYLATLREVGLVEDHGRCGFAAGPAAIRLAMAARAANPIESIGKSHVRQLMIDSDESVLLLRRLHDRAICVDGVESAQLIRTPVKIGACIALHRGAGPMVLLAGLAAPLRQQVLQQCAVRHKLSSVSVAALCEELRIVARRGWAICHGTVFPDIFAVAAPIRDSDGVAAAIVVAAPTFRVSKESAVQLRDLVIARAASISADLIGAYEDAIDPVG
jgi:DNA-binding IclR family transcriptional regulator